MPALKTDLTGRTIAEGRYVVQRKLDKGSMGFVFLAFDKRLSNDVVLKVPTDKRLADPEFHKRFLQESRLLTQLNHPRIVKILDVGEEEGVPYYVMPYIGGGNLLDRTTSADGTLRQLKPASIRDWLPDMAEALDFMHQKGYVHRDVKPANILFDESGNAYLSDFGLSKVLLDDEVEASGLTAANAVVGTPNYVAPELVLAKKDYDGRVDQYSLAVTLYEVLAGKAPFEGGSPTATMVNQTTKHPKLLHEVNLDVPEDMATAVRLAMSKRPWRRYETCVGFSNAVLAGLASTSTSGVQASSRSSATAYSTVVEARPDLFVASTSTGSGGMIPCPACGEKLALKARYAGHRGSCVHCGGKLLISKDLKQLSLLKKVELADSSGTMTASAGQSTTSGEIVLGTELLGMRFTSRLGMIITLLAFLLLLVAAVYVGRQSAEWSPSESETAPFIEHDDPG